MGLTSRYAACTGGDTTRGKVRLAVAVAGIVLTTTTAFTIGHFVQQPTPQERCRDAFRSEMEAILNGKPDATEPISAKYTTDVETYCRQIPADQARSIGDAVAQEYAARLTKWSGIR